MDGVDGVFQLRDSESGDLGEVGAFGVPAANKAVGILDGAFFPGGVGMRVVDLDGPLGAEEGFDGRMVEEFAAVVGGDGQDLDDFAAVDGAPEGPEDFALGDVAELFDNVVSAY